MAYTLAWLQGNQGVTDAGMAHVGCMSELKSLEVQFCWQLTDAGVSLVPYHSTVFRFVPAE